MSNIDTSQIIRFLESQEYVSLPSYSSEDHDSLERNGLNDYLYKSITRGNFRRTAIDDQSEQDTKEKIARCISSNEPIGFSIPFGAYKNWRLWSYPDPDWAEVFNIQYMISYVAPIAAVYEPGVVLHYSYGDNVMDLVSNMPPADTQRYISIFKKLVSYFNELTPENLKVTCTRVNEFYSSPEEHMEELHANYKHTKKHWYELFNEDQRKEKLDSARRNLMPKGVKDLTILSDAELEDAYLDSAMWCNAHDSLKERRGFNKFGTNIQLVYVRGPKPAIHVGSVETSAFHFWVGTGVIEVRPERILRRIISQPSLDKLIQQNSAMYVEVENKFEKFSDNYAKVPVINNSQ